MEAMEMAQRIRAARTLRGWTRKELSKASGVGYETLGRIERGQRDVKPEELLDIANACCVPVQWFDGFFEENS